MPGRPRPGRLLPGSRRRDATTDAVPVTVTVTVPVTVTRPRPRQGRRRGAAAGRPPRTPALPRPTVVLVGTHPGQPEARLGRALRLGRTTGGPILRLWTSESSGHLSLQLSSLPAAAATLTQADL